ncbi:MAG: carbohydrate kinase [Acholeplasmataceae bacterium]|jgi:fructokinase|nr:carbohydrate kinase [Acholeplasmataceae bacterium]
MRHLVCIGELLIDFLPNEKGIKLEQVKSFTKHPGGAPANVAVAGRKSGIKSYFVGQVGEDAFGNYLKKTLNDFGVDTNNLYQTKKAKTALAYVSLTDDGERDFVFYRNPSADQLFDMSLLDYNLFKKCVLHFCSVSLSNYPIKEAHLKAIQYTKEQNGFISFDPNLRFSLWDDLKAYKKVINQFIPYANLLKISDDELHFITGINDEKKAVMDLFIGDVSYIIITKGKKGSTLYYKDETQINIPAHKVDVVDTTGAGDAYIGTFLAEMIKYDLNFDKENVKSAMEKASLKAAITTTKMGGMSSIPSDEEI